MRGRDKGTRERDNGDGVVSFARSAPSPADGYPPTPVPPSSLVRSFGYAIAGILQLVRRQRNARIHVIVTVAVCAASAAWGLSRVEWLVLILTIAMVLGMEGLNTAIEAVVDLASPQFHPLAKQAKDVAAGAVLLVALGAVGVAILLYGARLLDLLQWLLG